MFVQVNMVDITKDNELICVEPVSCGGRMVIRDNGLMDLSSGGAYKHQQANRCFPEITKLPSDNWTKLKTLLVNQSEAILFSGNLIHAGNPIKDMKQRRHAVTRHYIHSESEI